MKNGEPCLTRHWWKLLIAMECPKPKDTKSSVVINWAFCSRYKRQNFRTELNIFFKKIAVGVFSIMLLLLLACKNHFKDTVFAVHKSQKCLRLLAGVLYIGLFYTYTYWSIKSPFRWFTVKEPMYTIKHNSSQVNGCAFLIRVAVLIPLWTTDGIYKLRLGGGSCILLSCRCTITSSSTSSRGSGIFSLFFKTHPWYVLQCWWLLCSLQTDQYW